MDTNNHGGIPKDILDRAAASSANIALAAGRAVLDAFVDGFRSGLAYALEKNAGASAESERDAIENDRR